MPDLIKRLGEMNISTYALTDYSGIYGAVDFYKKAGKADIKPLLGVEMPFTPDRSRIPTSWGYLSLLARSSDGYLNLLKIVSDAHMNKTGEVPFIDLPLIEKYSADVSAFW
jgi:DNA polymerase III subunit alpha